MISDQQAAKSVQRLIGLTGGVSMGKTTVSTYLATVHRLPVLDADVFAHQAVEPGTPILAAIAERYGTGILLATGHLNRHRLGDIIFNSSSERLWLEQQIHPFVRDRLTTALKTSPLQDGTQNPIVVLVVPLLFEARMTDLVTETWVVQCSAAQQLQRLLARDRLTLEQAQARINSQMAISKKTARADVVLENDTTPEALFQQIDRALMPSESDRLKIRC